MSFGRNLATVRKEKGLTQEALVQKSGVAISQIRRYEADKSSPTLDVLMRLATALGVSIDALALTPRPAWRAGRCWIGSY